MYSDHLTTDSHLGSLPLCLLTCSLRISPRIGPARRFRCDSCADDIARAGWPFRFYERGGFDYRFEFNLPILLLDLAIGTVLAGVLGRFIARTKFAPDY